MPVVASISLAVGFSLGAREVSALKRARLDQALWYWQWH